MSDSFLDLPYVLASPIEDLLSVFTSAGIPTIEWGAPSQTRDYFLVIPQTALPLAQHHLRRQGIYPTIAGTRLHIPCHRYNLDGRTLHLFTTKLPVH